MWKEKEKDETTKVQQFVLDFNPMILGMKVN